MICFVEVLQHDDLHDRQRVAVDGEADVAAAEVEAVTPVRIVLVARYRPAGKRLAQAKAFFLRDQRLQRRRENDRERLCGSQPRQNSR